jgi:hypothetical protein
MLVVVCMVALNNGFMLHMVRGGCSDGGRGGGRGRGAPDAGGATKKAFRDDPSAPGTRLNKVTISLGPPFHSTPSNPLPLASTAPYQCLPALSRRGADTAIAEGRVTVNDVCVLGAGTRVRPGDLVKLDDKKQHWYHPRCS